MSSVLVVAEPVRIPLFLYNAMKTFDCMQVYLSKCPMLLKALPGVPVATSKHAYESLFMCNMKNNSRQVLQYSLILKAMPN